MNTNKPRKPFIKPRCIPCVLEVGIKYIKLGLEQTNLSKEEKTKQEFTGIQKLIKIIHEQVTYQIPPNEIASTLFKEAAAVSGIEDIWKGIRDEANRICLTAIPYFEKAFEKIPAENKRERLKHAIKLAVLGNNFDIGTNVHNGNISEEDVQKSIDELDQLQFAFDDFELFWEDMVDDKKKNILVLLDNAGEIAFDRILIRTLKEFGKKIVAVVKDAPISNDAIMNDALAVGINNECEVITTGSSDLGYDPKNASGDFMEKLTNFDIVLLKGMANFEAIFSYQHLHSNGKANYYSLLKLKCETHAELFGQSFGSYIFKKIDIKDDTFNR